MTVSHGSIIRQRQQRRPSPNRRLPAIVDRTWIHPCKTLHYPNPTHPDTVAYMLSAIVARYAHHWPVYTIRGGRTEQFRLAQQWKQIVGIQIGLILRQPRTSPRNRQQLSYHQKNTQHNTVKKSYLYHSSKSSQSPHSQESHLSTTEHAETERDRPPLDT